MALKRTGGGSKGVPVLTTTWASQVLIALQNGTDEVPKDWVTNRQLQDAWGLCVAQVNVLLARGVRAGKVEVRKFRIRSASGITRPVPHYRFKG